MAKATDFTFFARLGHEKYQLSDDQLSPKWAWLGHMTHFRISHPLKYLWNG